MTSRENLCRSAISWSLAYFVLTGAVPPALELFTSGSPVTAWRLHNALLAWGLWHTGTAAIGIGLALSQIRTMSIGPMIAIAALTLEVLLAWAGYWREGWTAGQAVGLSATAFAIWMGLAAIPFLLGFLFTRWRQTRE